MTEIISLVKRYGERTVLSVDSLTIKDGETVVIIGPNGSGKSTLLKILAGIIKPTEGTVETEGKVLYLPQFSAPFSKSVRKNILFCAEGDKKQAEKRADELIKKLGLEQLRDKNASKLSGGELRKTAVCRLLVNDCRTLILDEPTAPADIRSAELIRDAITEYKQRTGCTVIMTTHSPVEAEIMADRIVMLHDGKVTEDGKPRDLLENPVSEWGKKFISLWKL